jgi:ribosomal protein S18 acetylase RimI-like enzyme
MTSEELACRPEVLAEYDFRGTKNDCIELMRNGVLLHHETVTYGIWEALNLEERELAISSEGNPYDTREREREALLVRQFQMLHRADASVVHPPTDTFVTNRLANFAYAIWVSEGRAVGYMALCDGTTDERSWDGTYESLTNVWVAHAYRRAGVATSLLDFVSKRPDVEITRLMRPFSPAGAAWAQAQLPHLALEPGRNDPCPCSSGRKYKRCCGV